MVKYNLTDEQWSALLWLRKHDPDRNRVFTVAWRPGNGKPTMPGEMRAAKVPDSLQRLNIQALIREGMLTAAFRGDSVTFNLTSLGHEASRMSDHPPYPGPSVYQRPSAQQPFFDKLLEVLNTAFDENEFRDLCFIFGIYHYNLPGQGLSSQKRELILHFERQGEFSKLWEEVRRQRPQSFTDLSDSP